MHELNIFELEESAEAGDAEAQYELAELCLSPDSKIEQNFRAGIYWLEKAAAQNNANALFRLGEIEKDPKKAQKFFIAAALQLHPDALHWLEEKADQTDIDVLNCRGLIACEENNEEQDQLAFSCFEKAAMQGDLFGLYYMAKLRFYGRGVEKNYQVAANLFQLVANNTHRREDFTFNRAALRFQRSANLEDPDVQYQIGLWYFLGKCIKQNPKKAYKYFMRSARQGNSDAQCFVGLLLNQKNDWSMLHWLMLAAKQGNLRAYYILGRLCFEQGQFPAALSWFDKIVKKGSSPFHFVGAEEVGEELSEDFSLTEFLIAHGFDVTVKDPFGKTPLRLSLDRYDINRADLFRDALMFNIFCRGATHANISLKESLKDSAFERVPRDVILIMIKFLSHADLLNVSLISRLFWQLAHDNSTPLGVKFTQRNLEKFSLWGARKAPTTTPPSEIARHSRHI